MADAALYEAAGWRWLCRPPGAIQSVLDLGDPGALVLPNHRAMMLASLLPARIHRVLDLGLGGGAISRHLHARYPEAALEAVEHSAQMLALCRGQFALPDAVQVHLCDAMGFLVANSTRFSLITCDLFEGLAASGALLDPEFYAQLRRAMTDDGALAINTLPRSADEARAVLMAARHSFEGVAILQFEDLGNLVLLLQAQPLASEAALQRRLEDSPYAGDPAMAGWLGTLTRVETRP